ncbi:copper resistance CopC/CopD family protein [Pseudonocardia yunnanensis]|uniref:Copper resistance CopC/CopD family protein n=1 Tax=Pseudonocardia yunnanensis TaxID=58107 RepID=A0ABW4EP74_9PSEU
MSTAAPDFIGTRRRPRGVLLGLLVALLWLVLPAPAASAHAYLLASTPPDGYAVPTSPTALSLDFDQSVSISVAPLELTDTVGEPHSVGPAMLSLGGRRLSALVPARLPNGGYRIRWEVTADDGDLVSGTITFTVGPGAIAPAGGSGAVVESPVVVVARWALFAGLALALGGLAGDRLTGRVLHEVDADRAARPRPLIIVGAGLGAVAAVVLAGAQVGLNLGQLVSTRPGRVLGVEILAFALTAALAGLGRRHRGPIVWTSVAVALLVVVVAEGLRAHPHEDSPILGTALTIAHLLAAGIWIGTLVHVLRVAHRWRDRVGWTRLLIHDYARLALILVAVVVATGAAEAIIVLPTPASLITTRYGLVLLAKVALIAVVLAIATLARRRLRHSIRAAAGQPLGRAVRVEAAGLVGVLAATAVLVSVTPAGPSSTDLAAPPPPVGPVVPVGTLAGQITVNASASAGQLVIRMSSPDRDDLGTDDTGPANTGSDNTPVVAQGGANGDGAAPADYRISALLTAPGAAPAALKLRGCGPGCFTSPVTWQPGNDQLRLTVSAAPWSGGTATLDIPWPATSDPTLLPAVLVAMRGVKQMTVHQAVTSNYTGDPGAETPLSFSGTDYLATEPYGRGGGKPVILTSRPEETEIGLGFPGGIAIRLSLGPDHRILHEVATTPNHLITTTFEYPPDARP